MKITFTLNNISSYFYEKLEQAETNRDKYNLLLKLKDLGVKPRIGNGSMRDIIEYNKFMRSDKDFSSYELASRRGYKLITFYI